MGQRILVEMARRRARPGTGSLPELLTRRTAALQWPRVDLILWPVLCAVVGAVATRLYMPERQTGDIDVAIHEADADRARERLRAAGYALRGTLAIGGSAWLALGGEELDLIEGDEVWWPEAILLAQQNPDPQGLPTTPLPHLVLMKLQVSRAQDLADISRMMGQADGRATRATLEVVERYSANDLPDLRSLIELGRLEWQEPESG